MTERRQMRATGRWIDLSPTLRTCGDVKAWLGSLVSAGIRFLPEEGFANLVSSSWRGGPRRVFRRGEAKLLNEALARAFAIADAAGNDLHAIYLSVLDECAC